MKVVTASYIFFWKVKTVYAINHNYASFTTYTKRSLSLYD